MDNNFQLRYLVKSIPLPGQPNVGRYESILQYRTRRAVGDVWYDWTDVPTVKEK